LAGVDALIAQATSQQASHHNVLKSKEARMPWRVVSSLVGRLLQRSLPVGSRSLLFGAHCFFLHGWFVAAGWWRLYGFPSDIRLWFAFFLHDAGYFLKPNMDGPEGETHPILGAEIMAWLFGPWWGEFTLLHSRFYAQRLGLPVSDLCYADKMAICLTPDWLFVWSSRLSGELDEYRQEVKHGKYRGMQADSDDPYQWHRNVQAYLRAWLAAELAA
jgi:hypothetical protein